MSSLSLCYIIKNEEAYLEASLLSAKDIADEVLVFDTGSKDQSMQILSRLRSEDTKIQIHKLEWRDDFSWARNYAADYASYDWVLFLDGDEILDPHAATIIAKEIQSPEAESYSITQRNYTYETKYQNLKTALKLPDFLSWTTPIYYFDNKMERLYKKSSNLKYEGRIHESLLPSSRRLKLQHKSLDAVVHHAGRLKNGQEQKLKYYTELTQKKLSEDSKNPAAWVESVMLLSERSQFGEAFHLAQKAVKHFPCEPQLWKIAAFSALKVEQFGLAEKLLHRFLAHFPEDEEALSQLTTALLYQRRMNECEKTCQQLLKSNAQNFYAHFHLGVLYFEKQMFVEAKSSLENALRLRPHDKFIQEALAKIPS